MEDNHHWFEMEDKYFMIIVMNLSVTRIKCSLMMEDEDCHDSEIME